MICRECKDDIDEENFYIDNLRPRGRVSRCKKCYSAKQKIDRLGARRRFHEAKANALRRGFSWNLTFDQFVLWIANGSCFYCGENSQNGIDRLNNEPYYDMSNAVSCCGPCNQMKSSMLMRDFFERVKKIASKCGLMTAEEANASIALEK